MNYLEEIINGVQSRPIPWEGYTRSGDIAQSDAEPLESAERAGKDRIAHVGANPQQYAEVVARVLQTCKKDDVLRFSLVFANNVLPQVPAFAENLSRSADLWPALIELLARSDENTPLLAANLMVALASQTVAPAEDVSKLFKYLSGLVQSNNAQHQELALQWIATLLQQRAYRSSFWGFHAQVLPVIDEIIRPPAKGGLQAQYHGLLALWLLSFDAELARSMSTDYNSVDVVLQVAKAAVKEKIIRVAVAVLVNLVQFAPSAAATLIGQRGLPVINALAERKWSDEELRDDIVKLRDDLTKTFDNMSTFDVYLTELNSKHLQWSPPHRSSAFWKANIGDFAANDYKVLRKLLKLLLSSTSPLNEAVACNDIAYIINEDPAATAVLSQENVKTHIMGLMESTDPEVRYEALKATQAFISKLLK